ncbi:MAG TPA: sulfatase-like hydrolase/transferase, partial [Prolixibacteraceae bacterium]|nr:sulfatase-like hydrolase/transferase [Prolixibacteraceae bacterium]
MKFKTFTRFSTGLVLGVSTGLVSSGAEGQSKPNVVWLIAEDLSPDIACYGNPLVKTPNIDRLAAEGVRFTQAFASCPVCSPTRSAFNTGMYQTSVGAHNHRTTGRQPLPDGILLVSEHFRNAGYFVCNGSGNPGSKPGKTDFNYAVDHPFDGTDWSLRKAGQPFFAQVQFRWTHRDFKKDTENP